MQSFHFFVGASTFASETNRNVSSIRLYATHIFSVSQSKSTRVLES